MTDRRLLDPPAPRMGARRQGVLAHLRQAPGPVGVDDVALATGLHANTARFHLDGLVEDGLAERSLEKRSTPGRRRVLYAARSRAAGQRSYGLLSEMLTGMVARLEGAGDAAVRTGRSWGRSLARSGVPSPPSAPAGEGPQVPSTTPEGAVEELRRVFDQVGFDPQVVPGADGVTEIRLRHCPFVEVASRHTEVVCSIHLGLMQGVLEEADGGVVAESLEPFVTPDLCVARVRAQAGAGETRPMRTRHTSGPSSR